MRNKYFDHPAISRGLLHNFKTSPKSGAKFVDIEKVDTEAMNFGRAFHSFMEFDNEEDFLKTTLVYNDKDRPEPNKNFNSTKNKEWKKSVLSTSKDVITVEQYNVIKEMKQSILDSVFYKRAFNKGADIQYERAFYTKIDGREYKCLSDVAIEYPDRLICIDWKTTSSQLNPEDNWNIIRELTKWDLHLQDNHYKKIIKSNTDKEVIFVFFFVESNGANECMPVVISEDSDLAIKGEYLWNKCNDNYIQYLNGSRDGVDSMLNNGMLIL